MAVHLTPEGRRIHYDIAGSGPTIVITPGGREGREVLAPLVAALSPRLRVVTWDRANTGQSDLLFDPSRSEQAIWAEDLIGLVEALELGPCVIAGG